MEFLLINHPLDCPICDQGGECQLQDLAVGYGNTTSRYSEEKRVVFHKNVGPLISMEEMSRCIHCTRCVRFGQEIAGVMELGMLNRGEHSEITSFVGSTVDSELSGNMIDLCPVGALTSKPFRYSARTWELGRKRSVSPHDSLGSNIILQTKANQVLRTVPLENDAINECWISDKDRFAYEGLNSADRLKVPMVKQDNRWIETSWEAALDYVSRSLNSIKADHGADAIAALAHPMASVEELYLLQKVMRGLGSSNVETRLRKAESGEIHATLLAYAGLKRLGLHNRATSLLNTNDFLPAIGQGAIGLTLRSEDRASQARVAPILDAATGYALAAERAFLNILDGSCKTPIAGLAELVGDRLTFRGMVLRTDGSATYQITREGAKTDGAMRSEEHTSELQSH